MGVQVPHVNTAEDARRAVASVKFGPGAARGLAAGTRPDSWGLGARMPDFAQPGQRAVAGVRPARARGGHRATSMRSWPSRASTCSSSARPTSRSPWAFPAIPRRRRSPRPSTTPLARILAAGRTPGMPATPETLADVQAKGCRYIYTHLPRLLGLGASAFLTSLSPPRWERVGVRGSDKLQRRRICSLLPLPARGERVGVRGGGKLQRRCIWPPLTLTLSPLKNGEMEPAAA